MAGICGVFDNIAVYRSPPGLGVDPLARSVDFIPKPAPDPSKSTQAECFPAARRYEFDDSIPQVHCPFGMDRRFMRGHRNRVGYARKSSAVAWPKRAPGR